jgi:hypothetical protein
MTETNVFNIKKYLTSKKLEEAFDDDEETISIEYMKADEASKILAIMNYQQEMFLGGLNDDLMSTELGIYTETKEQFEKIVYEWEKLYAIVEKQKAND